MQAPNPRYVALPSRVVSLLTQVSASPPQLVIDASTIFEDLSAYIGSSVFSDVKLLLDDGSIVCRCVRLRLLLLLQVDRSFLVRLPSLLHTK